jgi:hypothetical protein
MRLFPQDADLDVTDVLDQCVCPRHEDEQNANNTDVLRINKDISPPAT